MHFIIFGPLAHLSLFLVSEFLTHHGITRVIIVSPYQSIFYGPHLCACVDSSAHMYVALAISLRSAHVVWHHLQASHSAASLCRCARLKLPGKHRLLRRRCPHRRHRVNDAWQHFCVDINDILFDDFTIIDQISICDV
jgi:hypothetical protein